MERIRLTKTEKQVLRLAATGDGRPATYPAHEYNAAARSLSRKGLAKSKFYTNGEICTLRLTDEGRQYLCENPGLKNPTEWKKISTWVAIAGAAISAISVFISCSILSALE